MEKKLPKYASIPLGVACVASAVVLLFVGTSLVIGKTTFTKVGS